MNKFTVNLAAKAASVNCLGPGPRVVIWVQGCLQDCSHCMARSWRSFEAAELVSADDLACWIASQDGCRGLTISGGEPMLQAQSLMYLWNLVLKARPDWDLIVFSGYDPLTITDEANHARLQMLHAADAFIGGPYEHEKNDGSGLRGSTNQQIVFSAKCRFSSKERDLIVKAPREVEVRIQKGSALIVGIPSRQQNIEKMLGLSKNKAGMARE